MGQRPQVPPVHSHELARPVRRAVHHDRAPVAPHIEFADDAARSGEALHMTIAHSHTREHQAQVIFQPEVNPFPIGRPLRIERVAIERGGRHLRLASLRADDGRLYEAVPHVFGLTARHVRDVLSIRAERRRARAPLLRRIAVGAKACRELPRSALRKRFCDVEIPVVLRIRLIAAFGEENDLRSIGRPRRLQLLERPIRQLRHLARAHIEQEQVRALGPQKA